MNASGGVGRVATHWVWNEGYLVRAREVLMGVCLLLLFLRPLWVSPFMVGGAVLGLVHIALHWREIPWRRYWPLAPLVVLYLVILLGYWQGINDGVSQHLPVRLVTYVLTPISLVGLKPRRGWLWIVVAGVILLDLYTLAIALGRTLHLGPDGLIFNYQGWFPREEVFAPCHPQCLGDLMLSGHSQFYYGNLGYNADVYPCHLGTGNALATLLVLYLALTTKGWRRWLALGLMLFVMAYTVWLSSRVGLLALLLGFGVLAIWAFLIVKSRWKRAVVLAFLAGFLIVLPFTRMNTSNLGHGSLQEVGLSPGVMVRYGIDSAVLATQTQLMAEEAHFSGSDNGRIAFWTSILKNHDLLLPYGAGSQGNARYFAGMIYSNTFDFREPRGAINPHNLLFEGLLDNGWLGLAAAMLVVGVPLLFFRRWPLPCYAGYAVLFSLLMFDANSHQAIHAITQSYIYSLIVAFGIAHDTGPRARGIFGF